MFKGKVNRLLLLLTVVVAVLFGWTLWQEFSADINSSPVISFPEGTLIVSVEDGEEALLTDVTAEDPEDGDVTESLVIEGISEFQDDGSRIVTYAAFDGSNNVTKSTRSFYYSDYTSPEIILLAELIAETGEQINLQDCILVNDVLDGNITSQLQITESDYSMYTAGVYDVTLEVTNSAGDVETVIYQIASVEELEAASISITLTYYSTYVEAGESFDPYEWIDSVEGTDDYGEELTEEDLVITNPVNTQVTGQYEVTYLLTSGEETVSTTLVVIVR